MRFRGVGRLSKEEVLKYGAVGPTARASGVDYDVRKDDPYLAYAEVPFNVVTDTSGDVYGRTRVRVGELGESLKIVRVLPRTYPGGPDPGRCTAYRAGRGDPLPVRSAAGGARALHPDQRDGQGGTDRHPHAHPCQLDLGGGLPGQPEPRGHPGDCRRHRSLPLVHFTAHRGEPERWHRGRGHL